jgi:intraflagellar transport protein 81
MGLQIPEEFMVDNEIKTYLDQYKDLQAEFQVHHQSYEAATKESMNPGDLKREIG